MKRRIPTGLVIVQLFIGTLVLFGVISSVTENSSLQPFVFILLSAWLIIIGVQEYKRTKNLG